MNPFLASIYVCARRELVKAREHHEMAKMARPVDPDFARRHEASRDHFFRRARAYRDNARAFRAQCIALALEDTIPPQGASA